MHIAELAQCRSNDTLYRCDSMPANRWYLFTPYEALFDFYLKPDGTKEPFLWRTESDKYRDDETWRECGTVPRLQDGSIDLASLPVDP